MSLETRPITNFEASSRSRESQIEVLNWEFAKMTPAERIAKASELFAGSIVLSTSFGPTAPVMLWLASETALDIPVVTIRHGYETENTLQLADWYESNFGFELRIYDAPFVPVPPDDDPVAFDDFQRQIKVEPFQRMLDEIRPRAYFSGRMRWQSAARDELPFVEDKGAVIAVNPIADLSPAAVADFFDRTGLPENDNYYDPAKGQDQRGECQLNITVYS